MRIYHTRKPEPNSAANSPADPALAYRIPLRKSSPISHQATDLVFSFGFEGRFHDAKEHIFPAIRERPLFCGDEVRALPAQFSDPLPGVEIGPVDKRKVGDLARVVGAVGDADLLAGDVDGADPALVLQQPDVAQRREVERDEIGGP